MFHVDWFQTPVIDLLALVDEEPAFREPVTTAFREAERRLSQDPLNEGESRDEGQRCTFIRPLFLTFMVDLDTQRVTVVNIHLLRPHH